MANVILQTNIEGVKKPIRGKVRDIYDLGDKIIIAATDRISAFDVIMANGIPYKGTVLTQISKFWFDFLDVDHHLITDDVSKFPAPFCDCPDQLAGRSMLVKKVKVLPVECVIRAYITGSGWKEYQKTRSICGINLKPGLKESEKLPEPIFTPSTKEDSGHDINVSQAFIEKSAGKDIAEKLKKTIADAFYEKFNVMPLEGYGATELSPIVAMGIPDYESKEEHIKQKGYNDSGCLSFNRTILELK